MYTYIGTRITYLMSTTSAIYSRHDVGLVRQAGRRLHTQEHVQCQSLKPNANDRVNGSFSELTTPDHDSWKYVQHAVDSPLTATAPAHGKSMSIKQCYYLQAEMQPRRSEKATRAWLKQIKKSFSSPNLSDHCDWVEWKKCRISKWSGLSRFWERPDTIISSSFVWDSDGH